VLVLAAIHLTGGGIMAFGAGIACGLHLASQVLRMPQADPARALALFKSNRDAGLLLAAGLCGDAILAQLMA
ncbi:MAG: 4-hydroxybenzoate octaprenyltransferase, partial [Bosea sp. (in: a-proteobacteria)]